MKVAILALPRSGSDNFGKWLSKELNVKLISYLNNHYETMTNDVVVKYTYDEFDWKLDGVYDELKKFDYVITHYRKNTYEQAKSAVFYELNIIGQRTYKEGQSYMIDEGWENEHKQYIQKIQNDLERFLIDIKSVTSDVLMSYEELYYGDGYKKIEALFGFTSQHLDILNTKNRYFKGIKPSKKNKTLL